MPTAPVTDPPQWPELNYAQAKGTYTTLHMFTQVAGKVRLAQTPWINHSWHVTLYVTPRGLTTGAIPHGSRSFELRFDLVDHVLRIVSADRPTLEIGLVGKAVADFYAELLRELAGLGMPVAIDDLPNEIAQPIRFGQDHTHAGYDPIYATRFARALGHAERVFEKFRSGFIGKCSPVHFFWGSFDLAVTRFSGRTAPAHPGGIAHLPDAVAREAYSHEVSSAGFWTGSEQCEAVFYSYTYPEPAGFRTARVVPSAARFEQALAEFVLPYAFVRAQADPDAALLEFLQTTYAAAAEQAHWDRAQLECALGRPGVVRPV